MSIHPSLKVDTAGAQQRTVLTRIERIKDLMKKGRWSEEEATVIGLPKTKIVRVKAKKAVKEAAPDAAAAGAAPAGEAGGAKAAAPAAGKAAAPAAKAAPAKK